MVEETGVEPAVLPNKINELHYLGATRGPHCSRIQSYLLW